MAASAPGSGPTGIGAKNFEDLGAYQVSSDGTTISVTGTCNNVPDWTEFSSNEADRTGYYVAMLLSGEGYIGKTTRANQWKVSNLADCADGWIVAVAKDQKSFTFQAFASEEDAQAKRNGTQYTVDLSGVEYLG